MNIFIVLMLLLLSGCESYKNRETYDYIDLKNEFVSNYVNRVTKENEFFLVARGGSSRNDIEKVILFFRAIKLFDINQARNFVIPITEEFLCELNANKELRPYLHTYPAGLEVIDFSISFMTPQDRFVDDYYIANVLINRGIVKYSIFDYQLKCFTPIFSEPYCEALKIYKKN